MNPIDKFKFSQSALKEIEDIFMCPRFWYEKWIKKTFRSEANIHMLRGSYFEYLAIGAGATGDDIKDLPRLKNGKKSTDQIRIEEQADLFKKLFSPSGDGSLGYSLSDVQIHMDDVDSQGTLDFNMYDAEGKKIMVDLKLTGNIFSPMCKWNPVNRDEVDYLQQIKYQDLWEKQHGERLPSYMVVFDYSPRKNWTLFEVHISDDDRRNVVNRFKEGRRLAEGIDPNKDVNPDESICKKCPLQCSWRLEEYKEVKL